MTPVLNWRYVDECCACFASFDAVCYKVDNGVWDVCVEDFKFVNVYCIESLVHVQSYRNCACSVCHLIEYPGYCGVDVMYCSD